MSGPIFPHPVWLLTLSPFLVLARYVVIPPVVLIGIFLVANDVVRHFMGLLIFIFSSVKYLFMSFTHFPLGLFIWENIVNDLLSFESSFYILATIFHLICGLQSFFLIITEGSLKNLWFILDTWLSS